MGLDGAYGRRVDLVPDPSGAAGHLPGQAARGTGAGFPLASWVTERRPVAGVGVYRFGYRPAMAERDLVQAQVPTWALLLRAALNVVVGWFAFWYASELESFILGQVFGIEDIPAGYALPVILLENAPVAAVVIVVFGRMGRWAEVWRRFGAPLIASTVTQEEPVIDVDEPGELDPWRELREGGLPQAAHRLEKETVAGRVSDVDYVRIHRVWREVVGQPGLVGAFGEQVAVRGAGACAHPSEARDLPVRVAEHDLLVGQVRLGVAQEVPKNPATHRGAGFALDQEVLATSLLAVGPAGTGKTSRLARPVAEALCLQALARTACVVVVGAAEAELGPDAGYDVVIAPGDPGSAYGLDLYGAAREPDVAAARLADALLPDELSAREQSARMALQQVIGPFHAGYGRYPGVRELRALLGGDEEGWSGLVERLRAKELWALHEPDVQHRRSRHGKVDDPGALLADRLALLDRPAFAGCFETAGSGARPAFAMRALEHPLRVRVKLPERGHPEAARILSRLVVGQFLQAAVAREDRSLFAGLVVDDASAALDAGAVQGLRRLPGANAGAVLLLRSLVDLPEALRVPLFGAVGCRMAFPGIAPWDGKLFSEAWGTVLVRERAVTLAPDTSGGMLRKAGRLARKALSGTTAQTESVTTREVERERWSPSDLAHALPTGHAVVSLTTVGGEQVPPLLVDLRA